MNTTNTTNEPTTNDGRRDFDFYFGRWDVRVRRLTRLFSGSDDWLDYAASDESHAILGGLGCIDHFETAFDGGRIGMALRLFNPATRQWSIYWSDSRSGVLDPPVEGRFENGIGVFQGRDNYEGRPILVRNIWCDITPTSVRWEQDFSADEGRNWEVNCIMEMRRADGGQVLP